MKLKELFDHIPVITTKNVIQNYEDEINSLKKSNKEMARYNGDLKQKNECQEKEILEKDVLIKKLNDEKEEALSQLEKTQNQLNNQKQSYSKVIGASGGYTKEINKLKKELAIKDEEIEKYKLAVEESEKRNQLQASKINELTKKKSHSIEEYKNNGLRKNMNKKRGKQNEK